MTLLMLAVWLSCGQGLSHADVVTLFEETFDGTELPTSLTYVADPSFQQWLIDDAGRLYADRFYLNYVPMAAISVQGFGLTEDGLRFAVDIGRPSISVNPEVPCAPGGSNVGLLFGGYLALFHPGHDGGGFRLGTWAPGMPTEDILVNNQNMGFTPALDVLHHVEVVVTPQGSAVSIDVEILGLGTDDQMHTFNFSFLDSASSLGAANIGVCVSRANVDDAYFDSLWVEEVIPEPGTLSLTLLGSIAVIRRKGCSRTSLVAGDGFRV